MLRFGHQRGRVCYLSKSGAPRFTTNNVRTKKSDINVSRRTYVWTIADGQKALQIEAELLKAVPQLQGSAAHRLDQGNETCSRSSRSRSTGVNMVLQGASRA